jgi:hypothetical protein
VSSLLSDLKAVGAAESMTLLSGRLPAAGLYFLSPEYSEPLFRFGLDPDGRPADKWTWEDLA